jgi:hypothetical protein
MVGILSTSYEARMPRTNVALSLVLGVSLVTLLLILPGCKSDSSSGPGTGGTITVSGKVVSGSLQPITNSPVVIAGLPATVTDASGAFTIPGVTTPYDITVVLSASKLGITYRGLTRPDPTLVNFLSSPPAPNSATVGGTVSGGGGYPQPATRTSAVLLTSTETSGSGTPNATTGAYSLTTTWSGATTITTVLHALQWDRNAAGMPTAFTGYGEKTGVTVTAGGTFAGQNVAMTAATGGTIAGTVTVPAGLTLSSKAMSLVFATKGTISLGSESGTGTSFSYVVPVVPGTTLSVTASASGATGSVSAQKSAIASGATDVALTLPSPPAPSLPVDAATGVTIATPFSWTPINSTVYIVILNGPATQPDYLVITSSPTATIPDLTALGLGLPKGIAYSWNILALGPFANIDAAAGATGILPQTDGVQASSGGRTFTTAP